MLKMLIFLVIFFAFYSKIRNINFIQRKNINKKMLVDKLKLSMLVDEIALLITCGLRPDQALMEALSSVEDYNELSKELKDNVAIVDDILEILAKNKVDFKLSNLAQLIIESTKSGVNVIHQLTNYSSVLRSEYLNEIIVKANKISVKMLFPIIFIYLPSFILITVVPVLLTSFLEIKL